MSNVLKKHQVNIILFQIIGLIILVAIHACNFGLNNDVGVVMKAIAFIGIIYAVGLLTCLYSINREISFFHLFIALCFMFSFGQCFTTLFSGVVDVDKLISVGNGILDPHEIYDAAFYVLQAIGVMSIGYSISQSVLYNKYRTVLVADKNNNKSISFLRFNIIGWFLFIVSIVPTFYLLYKDIVVLSTSGYLDTLQNRTGIDKILEIFMGFFPASIIIITLTEKTKKGKIVATIFVVIYLALQLVGGSRITAFRFAILFATMYLISHRKIKLRYLLLGCIILIFIGFIFSLVSGLRSYSGDLNSFADFWRYVSDRFSQENLFYKIFFEAGNTQIINTVVYSSCPNIIDYCYGQSLFKMILSIFPNIGLWEVYPTTITTDSTFSPLFTTLCGLGSSIFAESYWNFGEVGAYIFVFIFGGLISNITIKLKRAKLKCDIIVQFILYYIIFYISFLVRGDMIEFGRSFVYYCLVPILIYKLGFLRKNSCSISYETLGNNSNLSKN